MTRTVGIAGIRLWPLSLLCALLPFVAGHLAWWLSTQQGLIAACNPYIDGCVSISRANRHGLADLLFNLLMDEALSDRAENILEWHAGLWLTAIFAVLAWTWRRDRLRVQLEWTRINSSSRRPCPTCRSPSGRSPSGNRRSAAGG